MLLSFKISVPLNGMCHEAYLVYFYIRLQCLNVLSTVVKANVLFHTIIYKHVREILFSVAYGRVQDLFRDTVN